jgi:hypothetical protein
MPFLEPAKITAQKKVKETYIAISNTPAVQETSPTYERSDSKPVINFEQFHHKEPDIAPQAHSNP